jgi:hypothetical protein
MNAGKTTVVLLAISLLTLLMVRNVSAHVIYHAKTDMIQKYKDLCSAHPDLASWEVIGHSVQGREIILVKIGNPDGGRVMTDGECHGSEDAGTEGAYLFAKWVLESGDARAAKITKQNYLLIIPIVNIDTQSRQNMRRSYTFPNGTVLTIPNGVNLNRNAEYGWGQSGSADPADPNGNYRGPYPNSEPETQAVKYAMEKYRPKIYVNWHFGGEYALYRDNAQSSYVTNRILDAYNSIIGEYTRLSGGIHRGESGGFIQAEAYYFNASAWLIEASAWDSTGKILNEDYNQYVAQIYEQRQFPFFLAMSQAVAVEQTDVHSTVDIYDAIMLARAFGSTSDSPRWNSDVDLNRDEEIDLFDAIIFAGSFGKTL